MSVLSTTAAISYLWLQNSQNVASATVLDSTDLDHCLLFIGGESVAPEGERENNST